MLGDLEVSEFGGRSEWWSLEQRADVAPCFLYAKLLRLRAQRGTTLKKGPLDLSFCSLVYLYIQILI